MSTTPGWPSSDPEPHNPFAAPAEDRTTADAHATGAPVPPPPSGYEAVSLLKAGATPDAAAPPAPPSPYGAASAPYGAAPHAPAPDGAAQHEPAPPSPYGATPSTPYGAAPASPYGAAPASPYGTAPTSPYGTAPASPYGTAPSNPYDTAPSNPYDAQAAPTYPAPGSPYGAPQTAPGYGTPPGAPPGYGYGQPGYPYPPPGSWGLAQPPVDGLAIASIATSGAGIVMGGFTGPVGVGLGIAALRRIRRTGARGRGLAVAGIVIGAVMTLLLGLFITLVVVGIADSSSGSGAWDSSDAPPDELDPEDWVYEEKIEDYRLVDSLVPGQCLVYHPWSPDLQDVELVECGTGHEAEVVAQVELNGPIARDYESEDLAWDDGYAQCQAAAADLAPSMDAFALGVELYPPHPDQWDAGGRTAYCVLTTYGGELTGSLVTGDLQIDGVAVAP